MGQHALSLADGICRLAFSPCIWPRSHPVPRVAHLGHPPFFKIVELALLAAIVYHTFNGIRILVIDFAQGSKYHKPLFWGAIACCAVAYFTIGWPLVREALTLVSGH